MAGAKHFKVKMFTIEFILRVQRFMTFPYILVLKELRKLFKQRIHCLHVYIYLSSTKKLLKLTIHFSKMP